MRDYLKAVFDNFENDYQSTFNASKPTYRALTSIQEWLIENIKKDRDDLIVNYSAGKGNWTQVPHFSILNRKESTSTKNGIYIVGLFQHSAEGVYLCIGQGVDGPKEIYGKREGSRYLINQANLIKEHLNILKEKSFEFEEQVELKSTGGVSLHYPEAVCVHYYIDRNNIPSNEELKDLFNTMLEGYDNVLNNGISSNLQNNQTPNEISTEEVGNNDNNQNYLDDNVRDTFFDVSKFEEIRNTLMSKKNVIIQGAPGVGKTFIGQKLAHSVLRGKSIGSTLNLVLHENYSYEEFMMGIRPDENGNFKLTKGIFYDFVKNAIDHPNENSVLVLDEINRANITKIFGELMVLIEHDKRGEEHKIKLMYNGEFFYLPENIFIIGLMNTADRSLKFIDYALRRRFNFFTFEPEFNNPNFKNYLISCGVEPNIVEKIVSNLTKVNQKISDDSFELGPGYCIGHSYFCPSSSETDMIYNNDWFLNIVNSQIKPLIEEYYSDNPDNAAELINDLIS